MVDGGAEPRDVRFSEHASSILATEHWSLLSARSLAYNESFSRITVFLTVLSASIVGLALVANTAGVEDEFIWAAGVLTPLVLFLGVTTYVRLVQLNLDDILTVLAMNRIRNAYLQMAPELKPYFTTGWHDDVRGVMKSLLLIRSKAANPRIQFFITSPSVIAFVNAFVAGVGVGLVLSGTGFSRTGVIGASVLVFAVMAVLLLRVQFASIKEITAAEARFPSDPNDYSDELGPVFTAPE